MELDIISDIPVFGHSKRIVTPGELITADLGYMRGHGTLQDPVTKELTSTTAGIVSKTNKLISVQSFKSRYTGEIGDVIIGRIISIHQINKR